MKQEEQNTLIFEFINKLTVELEKINEENEQISRKIHAHEQIIEKQKNSMEGTPEEQRQKIKAEIYCAEKQKHIDQLNNFLHEIEPALLEALGL